MTTEICSTANAILCRKHFFNLSLPAKERSLPGTAKAVGVSLHYVKLLSSREGWKEQLRRMVEALPSAGTASFLSDLGTAKTVAASALRDLDELSERMVSLVDDKQLSDREKTRQRRALKSAIQAKTAVHRGALGSMAGIGGLMRKRESSPPQPPEKPVLPAGGSSHVDEPRLDSDSLLFDDEY